ncbi:RNA-binding protein [Bacillus marinisedimentorum]|uniref:YlmH family RNA-binding protein n=1 Tax=Bacillus marinisedimentorum TaxID=1821260 RepID=UPI000872AEF2|nr:RNA-binding protein [Bacillus marinisedimentorum]
MSIHEHFRPEEHAFIDQAIEWKEQVMAQYAPKLTDFLNPREQEIIRSLSGKNDEVSVGFWGGNEAVERKRALLFPEYYSPGHGDFDCVAYEIQYPVKFIAISHRDVLGALMGLGLSRGKFGDILSDGSRFQLVVAEEISSFIELNLTSIGKGKITLVPIEKSDLLVKEENWEESAGTVSSLRLDAVISEIYRLSRSKAVPLIKNGYVKLNWKPVEQPSAEISSGDVISVRGHGRSKVIAIGDKTKKDKWKITYGRKK